MPIDHVSPAIRDRSRRPAAKGRALSRRADLPELSQDNMGQETPEPEDYGVRAEWGVICPNCGRDDRLEVEVTTFAALSVDGTDAHTGAHEWNQASQCHCTACDWSGLVSDASDAAEGNN